MNLQEIYTKLKLTEDSLIRVSTNKDWQSKVALPSRIYRLLEKNELLKTLDAFFCFDDKPLILFFNLEDGNKKQELHKAIWNFNESPIAIIVENNAVEIFNGFSIDENTKLLHSIGGVEKLDDFTYFELVTGKTWEKYREDLSHKNRVDYKLLDNIEDAQGLLMKLGLSQTLVNALIGKIIFYRYLIDRKVKLYYQEKESWDNDDLCKCLANKDSFFAFSRYLETKFNGDMFRIAPEDYQLISQDALNILIRLLESEDLSTKQRSLFDLYDFSILPIEFISNMYEKFIGVDKQDKESAYYTPTFLVDYIVAETVEKHLSSDDNNYNCRILDPSCGSGIFLVESLRRIIEKYVRVKKIKNTNTESFREGLKKLVCDNIFGIDKDYDAIQVAIFSIYLTLLDYQEPADIEKFKFPNLYGKNLICSDTFDIDNTELKELEGKKLQFDYIIGNPPWKGSGGDQQAKAYLSNRRKKERNVRNAIGINNNELAEYFVFRVSDFCSANTEVALIIHSTSLYNSKEGVSVFRKYLLDQFYIKGVTELACVRKEVFDKSNDKSIAPACVLFYKYANGNDTDSNVITHISIKPSRFFSLFKVFSICRNDIQKVQQNRLKENDWLWKVLLYGSYLDFNLISRLKKMNSIESLINDSNRFAHATGVTFSENNAKYDSTSWEGKCFINTHAVDYFFLNPDKIETFNIQKLGRNRSTQQDIFLAPMLLIRHGLDMEKLTARSVVSNIDAIFKKSLLSIKAYKPEDISVLKSVSCSYASEIFSYLSILTFSSVGIERENAKEQELLGIPYVEVDNCFYDEISSLYNSQYQENKKIPIDGIETRKIKEDIKEKEKNLNKAIKVALGLSDDELDLVDYALNVNRHVVRINSANTISKRIELLRNCPVFKVIKKEDKQLMDYAQVYIDRFAKSFNRNGKRFMVDIHYSEQMIGMFFRVINEQDFTEEIPDPKIDDTLLALAAELSSQRITDRLFVQKDVRGFEKDFFYVIKPNEKRLWHKAIARLDVNEFDDAMLRVGRDN